MIKSNTIIGDRKHSGGHYKTIKPRNKYLKTGGLFCFLFVFKRMNYTQEKKHMRFEPHSYSYLVV